MNERRWHVKSRKTSRALALALLAWAGAAFPGKLEAQSLQTNSVLTALLEPDVTRDGKPSGVITSEKRQHVDSRGAPTFEPSTEVGIQGSFKQDVYVVLAGVRGSDDAEIRVTFNPLVRWVWLGGALMALGGLVVMWPAADRKRAQSGYAAVLQPAPIGERVPDLVGA